MLRIWIFGASASRWGTRVSVWQCRISYIYSLVCTDSSRVCTRFVVVRQTWISPLMPDSPENSNTNTSALTWSWIQAWLVCPSHHAALVVVFASAATHFIICVTHSEPLFWVYLCYLRLSGILVGKYLHPFEFLMGKYLCIRAIHAIRVIWVVPCDLRRECLRVRNLSVSSHIRAPL